MSKKKCKKRVPKTSGKRPVASGRSHSDQERNNQIRAAVARIKSGKGTSGDAQLCASIVDGMLNMADELADELVEEEPDLRDLQVKIERLLRLFGSTSERSAVLFREGPEKTTRKRAIRGIKSEPVRKPRVRGADRFATAEEIHYSHTTMKSGDRCPECDRGNLYDQDAGKIVQLLGSLLFRAVVHRPERFRCSGCGEIFTAKVPDEATTHSDPTANSMTAVMRYGLGVPLYRLSQLQEICGVPVPTSTFWDMTAQAAAVLQPVYEELKAYAACCPLIHADDTTMRILAAKTERGPGIRKTTYTTGILARGLVDHSGRSPEPLIHLFITGPKHAGENIVEFFRLRNENLPPPIYMADGLSGNFPDSEIWNYIMAICLIHARRQFVDCLTAFPDPCKHVIKQIGKVYKNESRCLKRQMTPEQRLAYHQKRSQGIMDDLKVYSELQLKNKDVEPNSSLGKAFNYLLKHWEDLTRFLKVAGCPLDNNAEERQLKKAILHRKNSLFYKTGNGANVGDILMSVIQTASANGVNPFDYLTTLQRNAAEVSQNPADWLPWNYPQDNPKSYESIIAA